MENMSMSLRTLPGQDLVIKFVLNGNLDAITLVQLERGFREQLAHSNLKWIVDLGGLDYISGACLESLFSAAGELRLRGGELLFVKVPPKIQRVFVKLGFKLIFKIFPDEKRALESLSSLALPADEGSLISSRFRA
jgi:anti-anti-sigma factor